MRKIIINLRSGVRGTISGAGETSHECKMIYKEKKDGKKKYGNERKVKP